eukprot:4161451-Pleurochrysis_carterae.AAC.1
MKTEVRKRERSEEEAAGRAREMAQLRRSALLWEGRSLDRPDEVLAEAQVVDRKVDLEERVDHAERAPLFGNRQRRAVGDGHLG